MTGSLFSAPRPSVLGHLRQRQALAASVARDRLPHAVIFSGPEGVGKFQVALQLVEASFCESFSPDRNLSGCGSCSQCKRMATLQHPDLIILGRDADARSLSIDSIREVQRSLRFHPLYTQWRWVVVDGAERLTPQAQNAALKIVEESIGHTHFIFLVPQADRLLSTIRSRCLRISFGALSGTDTESVLKRHGFEGDALALAVNLSQGAPGRLIEGVDSEFPNLQKLFEQTILSLTGDQETPARKQWIALKVAAELAAAKTHRERLVEAGEIFLHRQWPKAAMEERVPTAAFQRAVSALPFLRNDLQRNVNAELSWNRFFHCAAFENPDEGLSDYVE